MTPLEKITMAKTKIVISHEFFAMLLLGLKYEEREDGGGMGTMGTDGEHLFWAPKFVKDLTVEEVKSILIHEAYHILNLHMTRLGGRNPLIANMAMDYSINYLVEQAGFKLPEGTLRDEKYNNWYWEKIYEDLIKNSKKLNGGENKWNVGGVIEPKNENGSSMSESQLKQFESEIKIKITQALEEARKRGNIPNGMERFVEKIMEYKVPWKDALNQFVTVNSRNDYSYRRPSKRYLQYDLYAPSLDCPELGDLFIFVDTSGSLTDRELGEIAGETDAIRNIYKVRITVIYCDAAINKIEVFEPNDDLIMKMVGGGGTDYRPPFDYIKKEGLDPICAIYFGDGYNGGTFTKYAPDYPVLWVLTQENNEFKPPYGTTIVMR